MFKSIKEILNTTFVYLMFASPFVLQSVLAFNHLIGLMFFFIILLIITYFAWKAKYQGWLFDSLTRLLELNILGSIFILIIERIVYFN